MAKIKRFEFPIGQAGLTTIVCVLVRRSDGYICDNADGIFRQPPAQISIPATEDASIPGGVYYINESRRAFSDDLYAAFFYNTNGSSSQAAWSMVGKDEGPVENDQRFGAYAPAVLSSTLAAMTKLMVKDSTGRLSDDDYADAVNAAIAEYSRHKPGTMTVDIQGNGTQLLDLPAGWVSEFSEIMRMEFPVDILPMSVLDNEDYTIIDTATGPKIRMLTMVPQSGEPIRTSFSSLRTEATIAPNDLDAVSHLGAAHAMLMLAARYVDTSDPLIAADVVNYRSKSGEALKLAEALQKQYNQHMGLKDDDSVPAASAVGNFSQNFPGGFPRLTHQRWLRERR